MEEMEETVKEYQEFVDILLGKHKREMRIVVWTYNASLLLIAALAWAVH